MTTLREAAQQALEALERSRHWSPLYRGSMGVINAIDALRSALAEPVLNPAPGYCKHCKQYTIEEPLPAEPVQEPVQEPVAWQWLDTAHFRKKIPADATPSHWRPLYTAPPQRKPLTEWQINDLMADIDPEDVCSWSFRQGVYAAEKHHGVRP